MQFCNQGWDAVGPNIDLALARCVAEGNGYALPTFVTHGDRKKLTFMACRDDHYQWNHPLGKDAPSGRPDNSKEAHKKFSIWFEWKMKGMYAARIKWAKMKYAPDLKAHPGLPCQVVENHPKMNHLIWPVFMQAKHWALFQGTLHDQARRQGLPLSEWMTRPWVQPWFDPDRVCAMTLARVQMTLEDGDEEDGTVSGQWRCPKPVYPVPAPKTRRSHPDEEFVIHVWTDPLDHDPEEEEKKKKAEQENLVPWGS
jgi:hypothetical protein